MITSARLAAIALIAAILMLSPATQADNAQQVTTSVRADIAKARQQLTDSEQRIGAAQQKLHSQYQALQQDVRQLRQQTALARRSEDENTLGLNQLTERLKSWQQQQRYQRNQLASFLRQQQLAGDAGQALTSQLDSVLNYATSLQQALYPQWQAQQVIQPNGELIDADVLQAGPVRWFWLTQQQLGGLLKPGAEPEVALTFTDNTALQLLQQGAVADIAFDPSLGKALWRNQQQDSALNHIRKGGVWALPILAFALIALTIALHKAWQLWLLAPVPPAALLTAQRQSGSRFEQQLYHCCQQFTPGQQRDDALFNVLQHSRLQLDARLGAIAVTAAVAPLLGLLGTVSGMIETFNMMTLFGTGDPQVVSGGIAQALITTELGLVVAIPALVLHALLSRKARNYYQQLETLALALSQHKASATAQPAQERAA
jgi:biopolymer transport protein ExbB